MKMFENLRKVDIKKLSSTVFAGLILSAGSVSAFADTSNPTPVETVINSFKTLATDVGLIIAGIGGVAISIYAVMAGWRFGKKIFNTVAK